MNFLERKQTRIIMAIKLKDDLVPEKSVIGEVYLKIYGMKKDPVKHSTGYFILTEDPGEKCSIIAGGKYYKEETFTIQTTELNPKQPFVDLFLKPNANYSFPQGMTVLKGKIVDTDHKPVPDATIIVKPMPERTVSEYDGAFFIHFDTIDMDKEITLTIIKEGFKNAKATLLLKKGITTSCPEIRIQEKQKRRLLWL